MWAQLSRDTVLSVLISKLLAQSDLCSGGRRLRVIRPKPGSTGVKDVLRVDICGPRVNNFLCLITIHVMLSIILLISNLLVV